ncbi:hypothetical protein [Paraflavitalea soli]|nr:hypothetical protein [Paraflavitalea soli]
MKPIPSFLLQRSILAIFLCFIGTIPSPAQGVVDDYQQFMTAYNEKKYERCIQLGAPLVAVTNHPGIQYKLAECFCQAGQPVPGLELLGILAKKGLPYPVEENKGFSSLPVRAIFILPTARPERCTGNCRAVIH